MSQGDDKKDHLIKFTVDGEPVETDQRELTPNQIIAEFGNGQDVATHYLVEITGERDISFQGKGNEPIKLHNGLRFQIISIGPTPVSDGPPRTAVDLFVNGMRKLGFNPSPLPNKPDHIVIDYTVPTGRFAGRKVRHGFIVPTDFPLTPPSGPHVSPHILPINTNGGAHPTASIHATHAQPFQAALGGEWQYWSRPFPDWAKSQKTVAAYIGHIWRLWDTQ